ncbi:MAG: TraB/GumN family protein [Bacteroidota bacterium]
MKEMNKLLVITLLFCLEVSATHFCFEIDQVNTSSKEVQDRQAIIKKKEKWKQIIKQLIIQVGFFILASGITFYFRGVRRAAPPIDKNKVWGNSNLLYKIEQDGQKPSYLHGITHVRSSQYTIPDNIECLLDNIDRLITPLDYTDEEICSMMKAYFDKLLQLYQETPIPSLQSYIDEVKKHKNKGSEVFMFEYLIPQRPIVEIVESREAKYEAEEFYDFFINKERKGLLTFKEMYRGIISTKNPVIVGEQEAAKMWALFEKYEKNSQFRQKITYLAEQIDEPSPTKGEKEKVSFIMRWQIGITNERVLLPKMIDMIQEKQNLFLVPAMNLNHILLLLLKKKYTITRIHEDGTEAAVTLDNYNEPYT